MEVKEGIFKRFKVIYRLIIFVILIILLLVVRIQFFSSKWSEKSKIFEVVEIPVQARRGNHLFCRWESACRLNSSLQPADGSQRTSVKKIFRTRRRLSRPDAFPILSR